MFSFEWYEKIDFDRLRLDFKRLARKRLLIQFRNSPILLQFLDILIEENQELFDCLLEVLQKRTLPEAEGVNLDAIGVLVGQNRLLQDIDLKNYFSPDYNNTTPDLAEVYVRGGSTLDSSSTLQDGEMRRLITAKIFKNHAYGATVPEFRRSISLLADTSVSYMKTGLLTCELVISDKIDPTSLETLLMEINNNRIQSSYIPVIPSVVELVGDAIWIVPTNEENKGIAFMTDNDKAKPDSSVFAIRKWRKNEQS